MESAINDVGHLEVQVVFSDSLICLQCFDTVGWAAGRASVLLKNMGMVLVATG